MKNLLIVPEYVDATGPAPRVEVHVDSARGADSYDSDNRMVDLLSMVRDAKARADAIASLVAQSITAEDWRLHQTLMHKRLRATATYSGAHQRGGPLHLQEVLNQPGTLNGQEALGMKLHAVQRPGFVSHAHDLPFLRPGVDDEASRDSFPADHETVIPGGFKRVA